MVAKHDEENYRIQYFQFSADKTESKEIALILKNPIARVRGPWYVEIPIK